MFELREHDRVQLNIFHNMTDKKRGNGSGGEESGRPEVKGAAKKFDAPEVGEIKAPKSLAVANESLAGVAETEKVNELWQKILEAKWVEPEKAREYFSNRTKEEIADATGVVGEILRDKSVDVAMQLKMPANHYDFITERIIAARERIGSMLPFPDNRLTAQIGILPDPDYINLSLKTKRYFSHEGRSAIFTWMANLPKEVVGKLYQYLQTVKEEADEELPLTVSDVIVGICAVTGRADVGEAWMHGWPKGERLDKMKTQKVPNEQAMGKLEENIGIKRAENLQKEIEKSEAVVREYVNIVFGGDINRAIRSLESKNSFGNRGKGIGEAIEFLARAEKNIRLAIADENLQNPQSDQSQENYRKTIINSLGGLDREFALIRNRLEAVGLAKKGPTMQKEAAELKKINHEYIEYMAELYAYFFKRGKYLPSDF